MNVFETRPADWLAYAEAVDRALAAAHPTDAEWAPLHETLGRVLFEPIIAPWSLPAHDNSAMDGYAVRSDAISGASKEHPVSLHISGESLPGSPFAGAVEPDCCVRIMTGGAVPRDTDSVVRVEHTAGEEAGRVSIFSDADSGRHVRPAGEDMSAGETVLQAGTTASAGVVAVLASVGLHRVRVHRRPRVGLLSSGDELLRISPETSPATAREVTERIRTGRGVFDSNGPMLAAQVREAGGEAVPMGVVGDTRSALLQAIDRALGDDHLDALVTTGGASMGTHDLLKRVFEERGFRLDFWRARIRPGSPVSLGWIPRKGRSDLPVFGLPGNPSSAFVTFEILTRPFLRRLAGARHPHRLRLSCTARDGFGGPADLTVFHRARLHAEPSGCTVGLTGPQGSGLVAGLGQADALAVLPEGTARIEPGEAVQVWVLRPDRP